MPVAHRQTTAVDVNMGVSSGTSSNFGSSVVAGNMISVGISTWAATVSTVTDTLGNTYTQVNHTVVATNAHAYIYRAYNISGGTNAVTVTMSSAQDLTFAASESEGVTTTDPNDANNGATGSSTTPSVSVTTVQADTIMYGTLMHDNSDRPLTEGSGWTMRAEFEGGIADVPLLWMSQVFTSAGAKTCDMTIGTGSAAWAIIGASFKAAGGGAAFLAKTNLPIMQAVHRSNSW